MVRISEEHQISGQTFDGQLRLTTNRSKPTPPMADRSQFMLRPRSRWSLLLTALLGLCTFSAPHLLGHAHAHHNSASRGSRNNGPTHRPRSGSSRADSGHASDSDEVLSAFHPLTSGGDAPLVAVVPADVLLVPEWTALDVVWPQDAPSTASQVVSAHRGRGPPNA